MLIPVEQAAKKMGVDVTTVRYGLQQNLFPFGTAVKCKKSWRYLVYSSRLQAYLTAQDLKK